MIHTPDGARVGLNCIWFGTAKDRKLIIKTLKEFHEKVATAEHGHLLFLGVFDSGNTRSSYTNIVSGLMVKYLYQFPDPPGFYGNIVPDQSPPDYISVKFRRLREWVLEFHHG